MTTTSERPPVTAPSRPVTATLTTRFIDEITKLHDELRFGGLLAAVEGEPLYLLQGLGDGLTTIAVRESQLPLRYLRGLLGFRLAQFLQMGWMSAELVHQRAMFHEPLAGAHAVDPVHTVTLTEDGRIAGYVGLVGSLDDVPQPLDSPRRSRFPAEIAHRVDLVSRYAAPKLTSHNAYEVKRFVRCRTLARGAQSDRVPWHLILCLGRMGQQPEAARSGQDFRILLGDSREDGALRHFRLIGFDPFVVDDTRPALAHTELMWPSYEQPRLAKPFAALVPTGLAGYLDVIESLLSQDSQPDWQRSALLQLSGVRRAQTQREQS